MAQSAVLHLLQSPKGVGGGRWGGHCGALLVDNCRLCVWWRVHTPMWLMHRLNYKIVWNYNKRRGFPSLQINTADGRVYTSCWFTVFCNNRHQKPSFIPFLFVSSWHSQWQPDMVWAERLPYFRCRVWGCFSLSFFRGQVGEFAAATRMHIWAEWWCDGGGCGVAESTWPPQSHF